MTVREATARVLSVDMGDQLCRVTLEVEDKLDRPLSPASLCPIEHPDETRFHLHRLVAIDGNRICFESDVTIPPPLRVGDILIFRKHWSPKQLETARRVNEKWRKVRFASHDAIRHNADGSTELAPGGWEHEHCNLCWATIGGDQPFAYRDRNDWLCEACYTEYILHRRGLRVGDEV